MFKRTRLCRVYKSNVVWYTKSSAFEQAFNFSFILSKIAILDRIKWEIKPPLPPNQWWTRGLTKARHFFHHWNWGRGGLNFSFILSKIAILDRIKWEIKPPLPPNQWWTRGLTKARHFFHHWNGGRGGLNFSFILSKIAILDRIKWEIKPPSPRINDELAV